MRAASRHRLFTLSALVAVAAALPAANAAQQDGKVRVLIITGGHGFEQKPFFQMFDSMDGIKADRATYPKAAELLKPDLADNYDVLVFYDMWAKGISPQQQNAFIKLLQRGIGIVALHHTMGAHQNWPEYAKIIGGRFYLRPRRVGGKTLPKSGFAHGQDISVKIANPNHPITQGLKDFRIHDETYNNYDTDPAATVLLSTDHPKSDRELAWVKTYGHSRVFYMQLGHDHFAYEHPAYRTLVRRAILWTAGRLR